MSEVVHEMRNQLAIAVANIEAFIDGKLEPTTPRLRAVLQALSELEGLIKGVDAVPRGATRGEFEIFDICTLIQNEITAVEATAGKKKVVLSAEYCTTVHADCALFKGNPIRVGQLVKNLLINAVRYTPAGGTITIDCHRAPGVLSLKISDTGPGIDPSDLERIFSLGYRGVNTASVPGDGIGLWVVRRVAEEHGGAVQAQNNVRSGATFTVQLPGEIVGDACSACRRLPTIVSVLR